MLILQRLSPVMAAGLVAGAFGIVYLVPRSVPLVALGVGVLYWLIVRSLPAAAFRERLVRWFVLILPVAAGGFLWLLVDRGLLRTWLPFLVAGSVAWTAEVLFHAAYRRKFSMQPWLAVLNVLIAWLFFFSLAIAHLLLNLDGWLLAVIAGFGSLALWWHAAWVYSLPADPWWAQLAWFLVYAQLVWSLYLLPTTNSTRAAIALMFYVGGMRLRLNQRYGLTMKLHTHWRLVVAIILIVTLILLFTPWI